MVSSCSIPGCKNRFKKGEINLYSLPKVRVRNPNEREKSAVRRHKWLCAINRKDLMKKSHLENVRVCCKHFITGKPATLADDTHPDWVPNINLAGRKEKPAQKLRAMQRYLRSKERLDSNFSLKLKEYFEENTCVIPGCKNIGSCKKGIRYNPLPMNRDLYSKWESQIQSGPTKVSFLSRKSLVCSDHFLDSDYVIGENGVRLWFKVGAFPSVFPWNKDDIEILPVDNFEEKLEVFDDDQACTSNISFLSPKVEKNDDDDDDSHHDNERSWSDENNDSMDYADTISMVEPEVNLNLPHSAPEYVDEQNTTSMLRLLLQDEKEGCCGISTCRKRPCQGVVLHPIPRGNALITMTTNDGKQQYVNLAKAWRDLAQVQDTDKICSTHFLTEDYIPGLNWVLQPNAYPSLNLPFNLRRVTYSIQKPQTPTVIISTNMVEKQHTEVTALCRICISPCDEQAVPIFSIKGCEHGIRQRMLKFLSIKVLGYDAEMPLKICKTCFLKLEECQKFADLASKNNKKLIKLVAKERERKDKGSVLHHENNIINKDTQTMPSIDYCVEVQIKVKDEEEEEAQSSDDQDKTTTDKKVCPPYNKPCPHCPITFNRKSILDKHLCKNHNVFLCHKCNIEFRDKNVYDKHVKDAHYTTCKLCSTLVIDSNLQSHIRESHYALIPKYIQFKKPRQEKINCKFCDKLNPNRKSAKKHYFWYHQLYACDICLNTFPSLVEQDKHTKEVHMLPCLYCDDKFYTARRFQRHVNKSHPNEQAKYVDVVPKSSEQLFECQFCKKGLSSIFNVKQHNFWIHSKYTCIICLSTFSSLQKEEEHLNTHGHMCVWCKARYVSSDEFQEHMQSVHPGHNKIFCCENCGECFNGTQELKEHRVVHIRQFTKHLCDVCGKTFGNSSMLNQHSVIHKRDEDKQKECHICNEKFFLDSQLKCHMSSHSKDEKKIMLKKQHTCLYCEKFFTKHDTLEKHIRQCHSNFICNYCDLSFRNKNDLKFHLKHVHFCM